MDVAKLPVSRNLEALKRYPQYFLFFFFFSQGVSSEKNRLSSTGDYFPIYYS